MSGTEDRIREVKSNISEFDLRSLNLARFTASEETRFHEYIKGICQRLLGDTIDLDKQDIIFVLSDKNEINAACFSKGDTNVIYLTEQLLNLCENEDQLAFILGHELGHYEEILRQEGKGINSKAEETACDLRAIQKMARGGYNLEEACNIAAKLFNDRSVRIESLKDPHTNDNSRVNLINAMKKKEKDRIIEEKNIEITQSTPIPDDIKRIVSERPKKAPFADYLDAQMRDTAKDDNEAIAIWMHAFYECMIPENGSYKMTEDDAKGLSGCINNFFHRDKSFADKFLAAVFAEMHAKRNDPQHKTYVEMMKNVLHEIYSSDSEWCVAKVDADEKDSATAEWLRFYLHGFREAEDDKFDEIIENLQYVENFVAQTHYHSYEGIYVKNFNLLELNFDESDVGKKISPQMLKRIKNYLNAKNKHTTFDDMTVQKIGDSVILTQSKTNKCLFVNSSGEVMYSFSAEDLNKMQTLLVKDIIENALANVKALEEGKITDIRQKIAILSEAQNIIYPVGRRDNLHSILPLITTEENEDKKEDKEISYNDVVALLSPEAIEFFNERNATSRDGLVYTSKITDLYADVIRHAPKEYFMEAFKIVGASMSGRSRLSGEDKLMRAFLDNPDFSEELSGLIKKFEPFPEGSDGWSWDDLLGPDVRFDMYFFVTKIREITDLSLKEHIEHGGTFDDFKQPFKEDLARLFGFEPYGDIDKDTMLKNLERTRNVDRANKTLYEHAYTTYYSYDALRSDGDTDVKFLLGYNEAGIFLNEQNSKMRYQLENAEKYHMDEEEKKKLQERIQHSEAISEMIHERLVQHLNSGIESGVISFDDIHDMTLHNNNVQGNGNYGTLNFVTVISNYDFEEVILNTLEHGDRYDIHTAIYSLYHTVKYNQSTQETDAYKEKIWPSVAKVFAREDIDIKDKVENFSLMSEYSLFASDYKRYYEVLIGADGKSGLLGGIKNLSDHRKQFTCLMSLMSKYSRIPDPDVRRDVISLAARSFWLANGSYNDITASPEQRAKLVAFIKVFKSSQIEIAELDKIEFLKELSELTMSQKELSLAMKPTEIEMQVTDSSAIAAAYGLDVVAYALYEYPETRTNIQDFLLGEGNLEEAENLVRDIKIAICTEHDKYHSPKVLERFLRGENVLNDIRGESYKYFDKLNAQSCLRFKKEFDAAPLEAKALIVNEIITSGKADWEESFKIVAGKLFADAGELGKVGTDFLHSYIAARPNSEKTFYLAAMMAAANNKSKSSTNYVNSQYTPEERNLAKGLRLFLENSGPAGTKLAQAMASYSDVPEFIRYEMQFAKSEANPPARWEIFSGNDATMNKLLEYGPLGKRRGSASFFVTYDLGDKIVKIMRRGAKLKADNEFAIYSEMLQTLSSEYQNITSFKRLVQNAAENVDIETDLNIGEKQYLDAKELYPKNVTANEITFDIQVMDWVARDKDWAIMEKAQGVDFKELEEPYKTAAAKAVFITELSNMLSGKRFDFDRHGGQYKFDAKNNVIGVFDTGAMSMVEPTDKERQALGMVLARTLRGLRYNQNVAAVFSAEIDNVSNEIYRDEISRNAPLPPYLSEFQRGMLALNDFYSHLSPKDMFECIIRAMHNGKNNIHPQIIQTFQQEMKKGFDSHNVSLQDLINPEKMDKMKPEARANRRIGKILFDALFKSMSEGKSIDISAENSQKLLSRLGNSDADLQITKGFIRGAYEKLNPKNYTQKDREELGMLLYQVCKADLRSNKLKKGEKFEDIVAGIIAQSPQVGEYAKNMMKLLGIMAQIPSLSEDKLKKAATFIAFTDPDVAKGYKKALRGDDSIGLAKRAILKLAPLDFVPRNAKKMLIRAVGKHFIANNIYKRLFGKKAKLSANNTADMAK